MSCKTFLIGDTHFGHKNIIVHEARHRPFSSLEAMTEEMVKRWNSVVRNQDRVFVVGDFAFGAKAVEVAGRLNGLKYLIGGNHDNLSTATYLKYFHKVLGCMEFDGGVITHIPIHPDQLENRYNFNIHGHLHSNDVLRTYTEIRPEIVNVTTTTDTRYINVSAEKIGLTPIDYDELKQLREIIAKGENLQ